MKRNLIAMLLGMVATSAAWGEEGRLKIGSIKLTYLGVYKEPTINTSLLGIEEMYPSSLYSVSFESEQSAKKTKKKGRIIGTIVGVSIGGGRVFVLCYGWFARSF